MDGNITDNNNASLKDPVMAWEVQEFPLLERGKKWYVLYVAAFVILVGFFAVTRQWTSVMVFMILAFVMYRYAHLTPEIVRCEIFDAGIRFNERFYSYSDIGSFAISYDGAQRFMQLFVSKRYSVAVTVHFGDEVDLTALRQFLSRHIPEQAVQEDYVDKVSRLLKF